MASAQAAGAAPAPASTRSHDHRRRPLLYCSAVLAVALSASALMLWFTSAGIGLTTDSAVYLAAADNLAHGRGATTPFAGETTRYSPAEQVSFGHRIPMVEYPPLYPLALSLPRAGGLSPSQSARVVNAISLAALVGLVGLSLWWLLRPPVVVVVVVEAVVISGPTAGSILGWLNPLGLAGFALSEALFLPLCMGALLAGARAAKTQARGPVLLAGGLVGLAMLTRYIGISSGIGAAAAILVCGSGGVRRRARRAVPVAVAGPIALLAWNVVSSFLWGGGAARAVVWHPGSAHVHLAVTTMGAWFSLPATWPWSTRAVVVVGLVLVPPAAVLVGRVRGWLCPVDPSGTAAALMVALGTFVLGYILAAGVTEVLLDAGSQPNQRLLAPVQLASYLLLLTVVVLATDRMTAAGARRWRLGPAIVAVVAVAAAGPSLSRLGVSASALQHTARTAGAEATADPLRTLPADLTVFTDDPSGLWLYDGHGAYRLPTAIIETTGQRDGSYPDEVRQVLDIVEQRRGLIVVSPGGSAEYAEGTSLRTIAPCSTGDVVLAVSGTPAAAAASQALSRCRP